VSHTKFKYFVHDVMALKSVRDVMALNK